MFRHRQRYIKLYQRRLFAPTPQPSKSRGPKVEALQWVLPLTHDDELRLDNMELNQFIPVPTLMNWRDIAEARMTKETEKMKSIKTRPSQLKTTILNEDEMRALEFEFGGSKKKPVDSLQRVSCIMSVSPCCLCRCALNKFQHPR